MNRRSSPQAKLSRREFLWRNACTALTATSMANAICDLRLTAAAAGAESKNKPGLKITHNVAGNYGALVCIFLFGGNDGNNLIVPTDTATYANYASARGSLALPQVGQTGGLLPLNPLTNDGHTYGVHPSMPALQTLFNSGQAAFVVNVGTLLAPLTQAQYKAKSVATPSQLFSHADQQIEWQTSIEDQASATGWGGRSADLLYSLNSSNNVSMNISLGGTNTFETGNTINTYSISTSGATSLNIPASAAGKNESATLQGLLNLTHPNLFEGAFAQQMTTAISDASKLNTAILPTASSSYWTTPFPVSSLGNQLKMIARMIQAAPALGQNRQVFFASAGGFDLHNAEGAQTGAQSNLLADLSASMNALYQATAQLGVSNAVTQFTASDFSRTFPVNGNGGADHAWGNNHIVVGGGVVGQKLYGTFPTLQVGGPDDTTTGRWIPTTSVDQYGATLAKWFGVSPSNMTSVFPYIGRFATADLGFMG